MIRRPPTPTRTPTLVPSATLFRSPVGAGRGHRWGYRLHWCRDHAWKPELATVAATRIGASSDGARLVVVDLAGGRLSKLADAAKPRVDAAASHGPLRTPVPYRNPAPGGWRIGFELQSGGSGVSERRARPGGWSRR